MSQRLLILSDAKPGHLNQSIAFARHLGLHYDVCQVRFRNRLAKAFSYIADRLHLRSGLLYEHEPVDGIYRAVVSAGSETYYANRVMAAKLQAKSVAIMLPQGYRYDFDLIVAQQHDNPPSRKNILSLPINLSYIEPQGLVVPEPGKQYIAIIVGGDGKQGQIDPEQLREQVKQAAELFPEHSFWLTTSRRTGRRVEAMLRDFSWDRAVYYSQEPINPVPDFLAHSEYVFLTADSTSMISEAVSFGATNVEVLPLTNSSRPVGKAAQLLAKLEQLGAIHWFDGRLGRAHQKLNLASQLRGVSL